MDIFELTPQIDTVVTKLTHPQTGDPLEHEGEEMWIERYLPHTGEYKKSQYSKTQKYLKKSQEAQEEIQIDLFEAEEDRLDIMVQTTISWKLYYGGEWVKFTPAKAKEIYGKASWIIDQLQVQENNTDVFMKA